MPITDVSAVVSALAEVEPLTERKAWPSEVVTGWMHDRPDLLEPLLIESIQRLGRSSIAVSAVVSLVSEDALAAAAVHSLRAVAEGMHRDDSQAAEVIALLSVQAPQVLTPHLSAIWDLDVNQSAYYSPWPWRGASDPAEQKRLFALLASADRDQAVRAAVCLMETRDPQVLRRVLQAGLAEVGADHLRWVGHEQHGDEIVPLTPPGHYHLQFPDGFRSTSQRFGTSREFPHPTWTLEPETLYGTAQFGGTTAASCPTCDGPVHRLVSFPVLPPDVGVTGLPSLELVTCLSCLGYVHEVIYTHHAPDGTADGLVPGDSGQAAPEFVADPLPEIGLGLARTPRRWQVQDWALSDGWENLNRLGGEPSWVQGDDYPACRQCDRTMTSLGQLDSFESTQPGGWQWGDGGTAYLFWCDPCRYSAARWQSS